MLKHKLRQFAGLLLASLSLLAAPADAQGVARIEHANGSTHMYRHVTMRVHGSTYVFQSPDRIGSLTVTTGACSYVAELQRCLPYLTKLHQYGKTSLIALRHGTVYINRGGHAARLPHSYTWIQPHEIVVHLRTMRGTYISIEGKLDGVS